MLHFCLRPPILLSCRTVSFLSKGAWGQRKPYAKLWKPRNIWQEYSPTTCLGIIKRMETGGCKGHYLNPNFSCLIVPQIVLAALLPLSQFLNKSSESRQTPHLLHCSQWKSCQSSLETKHKPFAKLYIKWKEKLSEKKRKIKGYLFKHCS